MTLPQIIRARIEGLSRKIASAQDETRAAATQDQIALQKLGTLLDRADQQVKLLEVGPQRLKEFDQRVVVLRGLRAALIQKLAHKLAMGKDWETCLRQNRDLYVFIALDVAKEVRTEAEKILVDVPQRELAALEKQTQ